MRVVGQRRERSLAFAASGELLLEGARFNDEIHRLPTGNAGYIPKGVHRFLSHEDANRHQDECLANAMAEIAATRRA